MSEPKRKTLAELERSPHVGPMECTVTVCVAGLLVAEYEELDEQFRVIYSEADTDRSNRRAADGPSEAQQIAERMDELREQMLAHEVAVRLRRKPKHEWREYVEAHPPRRLKGQHTIYCRAATAAEDDAGTSCDGCQPNLDDDRHGVNLDDLADDVGSYVIALQGETAGADKFAEIVAASASAGDLRKLARRVAAMHEGESLVPKSRLDWLNSQRSSDDSK